MTISSNDQNGSKYTTQLNSPSSSNSLKVPSSSTSPLSITSLSNRDRLDSDASGGDEMWKDKLHKKRKYNQLKREISKRFLGKSSMWSKMIVHPKNIFRFFWDIILGILIVYDVWLVPYCIAFHEKEESTLISTFLYIQDAFYLFDIFLSFFTGYVIRVGYKKQIELKPHLVALNYIKTYFIFDMLAFAFSWPFGGIYTIFALFKYLRIYKFLGLLITHGLDNVSIDFINGLKIVTMIITLVYFAHFGACTVYVSILFYVKLLHIILNKQDHILTIYVHIYTVFITLNINK